MQLASFGDIHLGLFDVFFSLRIVGANIPNYFKVSIELVMQTKTYHLFFRFSVGDFILN